MLLWTRPSVSASTQVMTPNAKANHLNDKKLRLSYISRNPESECCQLIDSLRFIDSLRTHVLAIFFFSLLQSCWCSFRHNISQCPVVEESCFISCVSLREEVKVSWSPQKSTMSVDWSSMLCTCLNQVLAKESELSELYSLPGFILSHMRGWTL